MVNPTLVGDADSALCSWGYGPAPFQLGIWSGPNWLGIWTKPIARGDLDWLLFSAQRLLLMAPRRLSVLCWRLGHW